MNDPAEWSTPGTGAPQPARRPDPSLGAAGGRAAVTGPTPSAAPIPSPPCRLGPLTVADILDGAVGAITRRPRAVFTMVGAVVLPVQVVVTVVLRDLVGSDASTLTTDSPFATTFDAAPEQALAIGTLHLVSLAVVGAAMTPWFIDWLRGVDRGTTVHLRHALRRSPVLLVALVLVHVVEFVGLFAVFVGAYVAMCLFHLVTPIVSAEGAGPLRAMRRSMRLTWSNASTSLALPAMAGILSFIIGFLLALVAQGIGSLFPEDLRWIVLGVAQLGVEMVTVPFVAGVAILAYVDLRSRSEGFDLDHRSAVVFGDGHRG